MRPEAEAPLADPQWVRRFQALAGAAGLGAGLIGVLVLTGWALDAALTRSVFPGLADMKANTAAAIVLLGASLWLQRRERPEGRGKWTARICAWAAAVVALLTLAEHLLGWNLGIDGLLFAEAARAAPGRMLPSTALSFVSLGLALLLLNVKTRRGWRPAQLLSLAAGAVALLGFLGYLYDDPALHGIARWTRVPVLTGAALTALGIGILLARPDRGLVAILTSSGPGGAVARSLLPAAIVLPIVLGSLRLQGQRAGLYGTEFGLAIMAFAHIVVFCVLVGAISRSLDGIEGEKQRGHEALRASEGRYRSLFHRNLAGVYRTTFDGRVVECNEAFARIYGYASREDILTHRAAELHTSPEARESFVARLKAEGVLVNHESQDRRKDGKPVWILENATLVELAPPGLIEGTVVNITERKRLEEQLRQSQKMEAVGRLAGGVAHDFNNILGVIMGYGELAQRQLGPEHPVRARVDQMLKATELAAALTRQLLAFSRKQVMQPKLLDLNAVVADVAKMLGRLIGEDLELVIHAAAGLGTVKADPGQIEQVILNLAVNARDAMPKGGSVTLETTNVDLDEDYAAAHPPVKPGRYVILAISDTGIGMDQETQLRIFEPFFTTKPEGEGTGLGLATVYGIVKQSGGHIWVYSEPGRGTTFKVYLPRVDEPAEAARPAGPPGEAPRGEETILLVEDTATLQEVIRETLEESGYTVLLASNGEEALELARERSGPIHLLLTDVVMPKLGGGDLAKLLSALRPGIRVLYMSGYTNGAISQHGVLGEGVVLLEKPFTGDKLARAVREALDGPALEQELTR